MMAPTPCMAQGVEKSQSSSPKHHFHQFIHVGIGIGGIAVLDLSEVLCHEEQAEMAVCSVTCFRGDKDSGSASACVK